LWFLYSCFLISTYNSKWISASKSDTSLRCPLRQTLPIFKQPVTYYPTQRDEVKPQINNATTSNANSGGKPSEKTKPRQLFWEKRFQNIRPTDIDGQPFEHFKLPEQIKGILKHLEFHQ
jgi:methyl-CpG-binding domain protein 2